MCAIAGILGLPINGQIINEMLSSMIYRGPDGTGTFMENACCLLHSRLAIVDPEGGKQPMYYTHGNNEFIIVYNGEIYNTEEVRSELKSLGHVFSSHSDTEVVLHAYAQWHENCVQYLNGIFAFAVWEGKTKKLFLARDRMGVKPLFYMFFNNGFLFSSEIKTILNYPGVPRKLDTNGIAQIVLLGPGRIPGCGIFKDIYELKPGCCGCYQDGHWESWQYWKLKDREHEEDFEKTAEHVRYLVIDSIQRQMISDVPIGTFLSGGLDSSIISSVCEEKLCKSGQKLSTFSLDFLNNDQYFVADKFQPNSDNYYINQMLSVLDSEHHWTTLRTTDLVDSMFDATVARDLPGMADIDSSLYCFCKRIRHHVKVTLSGECADEIFGGYPWYRDAEVRMRSGFPWSQNLSQRISLLNKDITSTINPTEFVMDQYMQTIHESDIIPGTSAENRRTKEMVNLNQTWFMQTLLDRKDRMSMACGLEVRVPFCDYRITEYLYGVPWEYKDYNNCEKGLLRYAMRGLLPNEVLWRKKSPYPKTYDPMYLDTVSAQLRQLLEKQNAPIYALVNREALATLLDCEFKWPWYGQLMKLPQTIVYMLQLNFWLENYKIEIIK